MPPASSVQQWKFMKSASQGKAKAPGLTKEKATEYISSQPTPKGLPERLKRIKKVIQGPSK